MQRFFEVILFQPLFNVLILLTVWIPGHSLGWAIILLTILIRFLLAPSAAQAIRQQHKVQVIQPELKEIQEKFKGDKTVQAQQMMALYKKYDIHPLGSCLPSLIQLPILITLYYVFRNGLTTDKFYLLYSYVPHPDSINTFWLGINLAQPERFVLPFLAGALQFIQTWMLVKSPRIHAPSNDTQKVINNQLLYFMPLITILISLSLPAALPLYWVVTTLFAIVQQWIIFRNMPKPDSIAVAVNPAPLPGANQTSRGGVSVMVREKGK